MQYLRVCGRGRLPPELGTAGCPCDTSRTSLMPAVGLGLMTATTCVDVHRRHLFSARNSPCAQGFFTLYRNLFSRLAQEENLISDIEYPPFGYSTWRWISSEEPTESARNFYTAWTSFSTMKDFVWMDRYNTVDAPDRRIRRFVPLLYYVWREHVNRDNAYPD